MRGVLVDARLNLYSVCFITLANRDRGTELRSQLTTRETILSICSLLESNTYICYTFWESDCISCVDVNLYFSPKLARESDLSTQLRYIRVEIVDYQ
jgi:hypothetical protein